MSIKEKEAAFKQKASKPKYKRPALTTHFDPPSNETEKKISEVWRRLFGIDQIGRYDNFYELGGHSLLATSLVNQLKQTFSTNLSIRDVLDHPTISELADLVKGQSKSEE